MSNLSAEEKDERLMQFLGMTEDRCDIDVARAMLDSCDWNLERAVNSLYDGGQSPSGGGGNANFGVQATGIGALRPADNSVRRVEGGTMTISGDDAAATSLFAGNDIPQEETGIGGFFSSIGRALSPVNASGNNNSNSSSGNTDGNQGGGFFGGLFGGGNDASSAQQAQASGDAAMGDMSPRTQAAINAAMGGASSSANLSQEQADAEMARALEESMRSGGTTHLTEAEQLKRAMDISANQGKQSERDDLKFQQDMEYQESLLIDQQRSEARKAEEREIAEIKRIQEEQIAQEQRSKDQQRERILFEVQNLPPEAAAGPEGLLLMFRFPSGKSVKRRFAKTNMVKHLYSFVDGQLLEAGDTDTLDDYVIASTFPKLQIEKSDMLLSETKLENQTALVLQKLS